MHNTVHRMWEIRKIAFVGISNCGKTALVSVLTGTNPMMVLNLPPTKGIYRSSIHHHQQQFFIWDFGGAQKYRESYIGNFPRYFGETDLVCFVIDFHNPDDDELWFDYAFRIIEGFSQYEGSPLYILFFIHKYDENIQLRFSVQVRMNTIHTLISELNCPFPYGIVKSSIFQITPGDFWDTFAIIQ